MAAANIHLPLREANCELRTESERLRVDLLRTHLAFACNMARFAEDPGNNSKLRQACHHAARNGYNSIMRIVALGGTHPKAIEDDVHRLRSALMRLGPEPRPYAAVLAPGDSTGPFQIAVTALGTLTPRETEVLVCIADGQSTRELAHRLGITFKTAACHRERIMDILGAHNTAMLVRFAIRIGLVQP